MFSTRYKIRDHLGMTAFNGAIEAQNLLHVGHDIVTGLQWRADNDSAAAKV